jgi:enoyl-CoA hydratase/carnithine racemase
MRRCDRGDDDDDHYVALMEYTQIIYEVDDNVATITLNRPDKLNAFTGTMMYELIDAFDQVDADDDVRAVIVTGAGRGFCAGADLSTSGGETFSSGGSDIQTNAGVPRDGGGMVSLRIFDCTKPVIGAINGASVGVGVTMTLPMDFRLASEHAKFGFVFARRGIVPEACSSYFLPRLVGISQATEWCYTGRVFPADEARAGGLVRSVHGADELLPAARAIAQEIAQNTAPVSVALSRQMLWRMLGANHPMEAHRVDSRGILARGASDDAREGVMSFLEKRQPNYPVKVSDGLPEIFPGWADPSFD